MTRWIALLLLCSGCAGAIVRPGGNVYYFACGNARVERDADGRTRVEGTPSETTWAGLAATLLSTAGAAFAIYEARQ